MPKSRGRACSRACTPRIDGAYDATAVLGTVANGRSLRLLAAPSRALQRRLTLPRIVSTAADDVVVSASYSQSLHLGESWVGDRSCRRSAMSQSLCSCACAPDAKCMAHQTTNRLVESLSSEVEMFFTPLKFDRLRLKSPFHVRMTSHTSSLGQQQLQCCMPMPSPTRHRA